MLHLMYLAIPGHFCVPSQVLYLSSGIICNLLEPGQGACLQPTMPLLQCVPEDSPISIVSGSMSETHPVYFASPVQDQVLVLHMGGWRLH